MFKLSANIISKIVLFNAGIIGRLENVRDASIFPVNANISIWIVPPVSKSCKLSFMMQTSNLLSFDLLFYGSKFPFSDEKFSLTTAGWPPYLPPSSSLI
jgi:hypothetical protein